MVAVAPSTKRTGRFQKCHQRGAPVPIMPPIMPPTCRANSEIISVGKRPRAWQYALVLAAQRGKPSTIR